MIGSENVTAAAGSVNTVVTGQGSVSWESDLSLSPSLRVSSCRGCVCVCRVSVAHFLRSQHGNLGFNLPTQPEKSPFPSFNPIPIALLNPPPAPQMAKTRPGIPSKPKPGKRELHSYTIRGTNKVVQVGDCVLMRPSDTGKPPYVARIEGMEADFRSNVKVRVRWYYRPEESLGGRRQFHGAKELFLSDHYDVQSAHTIEGKCIVHTFKNYTKLENVGAEDYYCRFEYKAATGGFTPDRVAVYCTCEMPYNPDDLMVQCEGCKDWYHPACVGMTIEEAKKLDHFVCSECAPDNDIKRSQNGFTASLAADGKVEAKRRKR